MDANKPTRKQASQELYTLQASMEAKPYSQATVYRRMYWDTVTSTWRFSGRGYDYTY